MNKMPKEVIEVAKTLQNAGFETYLVGGSVRDLIMGRNPTDWDIATNALPSQVTKLFDDTFQENGFGTVGVKFPIKDSVHSVKDSSDEVVKDKKFIVEVTTYRTESGYADKRHPDTVTFVKTIKEDLSRRDFTCNAIAQNVFTGEITDPYNGLEAIEQRTILTVGDATTRFSEDALRLLRAVRFHVQLRFSVSYETQKGILENHHLLNTVSRERIQQEFSKIILSDAPAQGLFTLERLGLLQHFLPELAETIGVEQGGVHKYDVWNHLLRTLQHAADKKWGLHLRLAALFHDIAKPQTRGVGKHKKYSFYNHEVEGSRVTYQILEKLAFSRETVKYVSKLVRWHMFLSDPDTITLAAVRRLLAKVGPEMLQDLIKLRMADRIGMGRPVEDPYRLRKFQAMVDEVLTDPISLKTMKINGDLLMKRLGISPGKRLGWILYALFDEVLLEPQKNNEDYLLKRSEELFSLPEEELSQLGKKGKEATEDKESERVEELYKERKVNKNR